MKNEMLKEIIKKLETIKNVSEQDELNRLISCVADLKVYYPDYTEEADQMLDIIKRYVNGTGSAYEIDIRKRYLIDELKDEVARADDSILEVLKETYEDAKDVVSEAMPQVKTTCSKVITTAGNIGRGFADTINKEIPQIPEGVEKVKAASEKAKKGIKSKIREWAFSDESDNKE